MNTEIKNPAKLLIVRDKNLPTNLPSNVIVRSLQEIEAETLESEVYVRFKRYIGLHPSGRTPWAVMRKMSGHHTVFGYYRTLAEAIRSAVALKKVSDIE